MRNTGTLTLFFVNSDNDVLSREACKQSAQGERDINRAPPIVYSPGIKRNFGDGLICRGNKNGEIPNGIENRKFILEGTTG